MDLPEFLLARADEFEARAANIHHRECDAFDVVARGGDYLRSDCDCGEPARVLAWCAAIRAIVELHAGVHECVAWRWQDAEDIAEGEPRRTRTVYVREGFEHSDDSTLLALAQLFADHADFQPAWRT